MSLFAIGDLHLHFQSELKAPGQLREPIWKDHEVKFRRNCEKLIKLAESLSLCKRVSCILAFTDPNQHTVLHHPFQHSGSG